MIDSYQQRAALEREMAEPAAASLATVGAIYSDGIALIFDGMSTASAKHYKCNTSVTFVPGQRVKVAKISGTYIVEYPVGAPSV